MNKKFILITDSCADLTPEQYEELNIKVVPLSFNIGGKTYLNYPDGREMDIHSFYQRLISKEVSTTSQPTPAEMMKTFEEAINEGYDILSISFSSALSGTYNSSVMASSMVKENHPDAKIICIDSLCASMGQGLLVYYAAKMCMEGKSLDETAKWVENNKLSLVHWFTVGDLGTLRRGGRLSATSAFFGDLLGIKPVLHVSDEGKLVPVVKCRGRKKSMIELIERCKSTIVNPEEQTIFISHGDCLEEAKFVGDSIINACHVKDVVYNYVGPVIGSHSGPGTIALFYLGSSRN